MIATLEQMIRRDRLTALVCVSVVTALAWIGLLTMSSSMDGTGADGRLQAAMSMTDPRVWGVADWLGLSGMWSVMMTGMMVPSVSPVLLHMLQIFRRRGDRLAHKSAAAFVGGHLAAWILFSAGAAAIQIALHRAALLDASVAIRSTALTGALLLAVGIYQCLPVKSACLSHCRPPLRFLSMKRQDGTLGTFRMGLQHGGFCVACCFALMALMFVAGVMNVFWAAAIAVLVLAEKLAPRRLHLEYASGLPLIAWGVVKLVQS